MYGYVNDALGLSQLGLDEETSKKIVLEVLDFVTQGLSSKPDVDTVLRRIKRFKPQVDELVSAKMLELIKRPTREQLEYIVYSGGRAAIAEVGRLYKLAKEYGREDLIATLQYLWTKYGIRSPVQCPKCGFNSVMPDYSCLVCGAVVTEKYVRDALDFSDKLNSFVKTASVGELRLAVERGYVLLGEDGVYHPLYRPPKPTVMFQVYLKSDEVALIVEEIEGRSQPI
ncbi:hypothetical protein WLZ34_04705 [Thermogladius sp. KZ2Tp1]|uniref:hypothetical protein n=1 Tax=unclassified Thermogladius TaxID=2647734 RepID=UPI003D0EA858